MRTLEDVRARLARTWESQWPAWAAGEGSWPLCISLAAPTAAQARAAWPAFQRWITGWAAWQGPGEVVWESRRWATAGVQQLPLSLQLPDAAAVARLLGAQEAQKLRAVGARLVTLANAWPDLAALLPRLASWLATAAPEEIARAQAALEWLSAHPDSGRYVRQLPIPGMDSKWLETNGARLAPLLGARLGRRGSLQEIAGLAADRPLRRLRILDPALRTQVGGLDGFAASLPALAALPIIPRLVLVIENLQTLLACQDLPGAVAIHGGGYAAPELASLPWLAATRVVYWGDIDTDGLAILGALRLRVPHAESVLMDEATLLEHQPVWSVDTSPRIRRVEGLDDVESTLLRDLASGRWGVGARLEQERIAWDYAWEQICARAGASFGSMEEVGMARCAESTSDDVGI